MRLKSELYHNEQIQIMNKVIKILEFDKDNCTTLYELDNNVDKQNDIMSLIPEIRKYFTFTLMKGVRYPDDTMRPWLSIIKHMTKLEYNMISYDYRMMIDDKKIRTKRYMFIKKMIF